MYFVYLFRYLKYLTYLGIAISILYPQSWLVTVVLFPLPYTYTEEPKPPAMSTTPPGVPPNVVVFGPKANCTLEICPVQMSVYGYRPSLAANIIFIALYAAAAALHTYLGVRWRQWWFMICMNVGALNAIAGYAGRVMLYYNPWSFAFFMLQISKSLVGVPVTGTYLPTQ